MYSISTRYKKSSHSGFTLIETLVAIGISVMVSMFVVAIATDTLKSTAQIQESESLHADVMHITTRMSYLIKQSRSIKEANSSGITLQMPDFSEKKIEVATSTNSEILVDGVNILSDRLKIIDFFAKRVNNSIQISFSIKYKGSDREYSFTTTLARRNN